jgi:prepilin-type N-terminal cleavage/methylation domain-containing protein
MKPTTQKRAFTLIETIVVVAIIASLAALLFPVFARVRENARRAVCKSNLHQIGLAVALYRADYDGMDPDKGLRLTHSQLGLPHHFSLGVFYNTYLRNRAVQFCPSAVIWRPDLGSTYNWVMIQSEFLDPSLDYEGIAALRGQDYPLVVCEDHNGPHGSFWTHQSSDVLYYHVLRIDGRVSVKKALASELGGLEWW